MYKLVDYYDEPMYGIIIAKSDSVLELIQKQEKFIADTDGECDLEIEEI